MEVLLVTTSWPFVRIPEFLDDEIEHLASRFKAVVIAPMRPKGPMLRDLPKGVTVDLSLSDYLTRGRFSFAASSRSLTVIRRAALRNSHGFGSTAQELADNFYRNGWLRQAVLGRADSTSVARWASNRRPTDIAYTFWLGPATLGIRKAWPNVPLVSRVHGGDLFSEASGWSAIPFQRDAISSCDEVASVSGFGRDYLSEKFDDLTTSLSLKRLGIRDVGFGPFPVASTSVRLISVSSIDTNKRVDLIAQTAVFLANEGIPVEWTHFGDGPERVMLNGLVQRAPSNLHVHLKGHLLSSEVRHALVNESFDVFINLSKSEGAPVSLMEAQCVGLPVVATAVGGTPEVVPTSLNELIRVDSDVQEIGAAVLRARSRPTSERWERRRLWQANYDQAVNYADWVDFLLKAI
jgi:colanic acid/amylovoran biosynthesis glycosyltransferase